MGRKEIIVCSCGGRLTRPLPKKCPHCGGEIAGVRRRLWPLMWQVLVVLLMFGALLGLLAWWVGSTD